MSYSKLMLNVFIVAVFCGSVMFDALMLSAGPPPVTAPTAGDVSFVTTDGVLIHGSYLPGKVGGDAVLLLHMNDRSSDDWKPFADKLSKNGFHTLTIDLRGHGKSVRKKDGKPATEKPLSNADYSAMALDVKASIVWLLDSAKVSPNRMHIVGASIGANLALVAAAEDPRIASVSLLSPGLEYKGISAEASLQKNTKVPVFIAVSREDTFSGRSALVLESMASGKKYIQVYTGAGHGTRMFAREPGLENLLLSWLNGSLELEDSSDEEMLPPSSNKPTK